VASSRPLDDVDACSLIEQPSDTLLPVTASAISKRASVTAHGDQQQALLDIKKQLGKAPDCRSGN
jgi:hypothetical protein